MSGKLVPWVAAGALAGASVWAWGWRPEGLESWIADHAALGAGIYVGFVAASVVLLPFSSLPLLPLATQSYGVFWTAVLSALGWWLGCLIAFRIARFGRPYLEKVTPLHAVDRLEERIPHDVGFGGIVVLRILFPVDIVSYALGLLKALSFRTYALASLVGILPFAFVWSYAGGKLGSGQYVAFALIAAAAVAAALVARRRWRR